MFFVIADDHPGPAYVSLAYLSRFDAELHRNRLGSDRNPRVVEADDREQAREIDEKGRVSNG